VRPRTSDIQIAINESPHFDAAIVSDCGRECCRVDIVGRRLRQERRRTHAGLSGHWEGDGATPDLKGPGTIPPVGTTDANGEFALTSYEPDDGAPAGKFQVTVFWPEPIPEGADEEMFQPKDRLKEKYLDPETSQLSAEIPVGGAELAPFEL
jgi:hypothetical protein